MQHDQNHASGKRRTYIFVVGGVMSGVGKGIATASIGALLSARGFRVTAVKIDPYLNVDPGTLNPVEHGEVFVTHDGLETDQDLGNYERFLNRDLGRLNCMTSGSVFQAVIERERALGYGGKTVEMVPHVPMEVISRIQNAAEKDDADVTLIEIGGTVGEYQNLLYLEACRMMRLENPGDILVVLVSYLPVPQNIGEMKTKPTQHAARMLNGAGLQPDLLLCRSTHAVDEPRKKKLSIACNVSVDDVISAPDVDTIYAVPINFEREGITDRILDKLRLTSSKPQPEKELSRQISLQIGLRSEPTEETPVHGLSAWEDLNERIKNGTSRTVRIGIVGKYFSTGDFVLTDSYLSVLEAIKHASWHLHARPEIVWLNSEEFEKDLAPHVLHSALTELDGILIPGGFGTRGIEGKISTIKYARENNVPYLGLCYGMQLACLETARHLAGLVGANSTEMNKETNHPVVHLMNEQQERMKNVDYGGSMRLGAYPCHLKADSRARALYDTDTVQERHRHRFELNPEYHNVLAENGLIISGASRDGTLAEIVERPDHPFFIATQFHPEFLSRPFRPQPLFVGFLQASIERRSEEK
ncbi:MAG: CTP synthase [bacterium]|nr:CTP synthase [bacterium]